MTETKIYKCGGCEAEVSLTDNYCGSCGGELEAVQDQDADMKKIEELEKKGYKVTVGMSGNYVEAVKGSRKITGKSVTEVYNKLK